MNVLSKISAIIIFFVSFFVTLAAHSQSPEIDIYELSIDELTKLKLVTASKIEQDAEKINATVKVITSNDIAERGYLSIDEALADLSGFQFRDIRGINSYIFQRGIPNQNNLMLLLVDGIEINELNSGGFYGGAQYNMANVERIEVVYGPASVAYGTNAVSGVVNIISKSAKQTGAQLKALGGSFNSLAAACAYNFIAPNEKYKVRVSAMGFRTDKNNLTGNNADNNWTDLIDNYENDYSFGMKFNSAGFSAGFTYSQKQSSNATAQKSVGSIYRDFGSLWNIRFINSYLAYRESFTKNISGSAMVYNRNATVLPNSVYYVTDTAQVGYYRPNNLVGAEMMLNYNGERYLNINSGLSVEYERLSQGASLSYSNSMYQKPPEPSVPIINGNVIFSAFLEPRLTVSNQLFVTGGARIDINKDFKYVLTPRVGLNYSLGKQLFRVFYAEAFRAPKPWDYTDGLGNSNLKPEKFRSYELSGTFIVAKGFSTQMSVYYNELFNGMMRVFEDDGFRWVNQSIIRTKGVELSFNYLYHKWKFYTNYTYNKSFNEQGLQVHEISPNVFNAGTTYRMNKNLKINLRANYVGERTNPKTITARGNNLIDAYLLLSGAITWIPSDQVSVQLLAKNLLDAKYYHSSNRQPDRYLQPGRGVFLTMAYNLNK